MATIAKRQIHSSDNGKYFRFHKCRLQLFRIQRERMGRSGDAGDENHVQLQIVQTVILKQMTNGQVFLLIFFTQKNDTKKINLNLNLFFFNAESYQPY
jgi:hypothetical protein